MSRRALAIRQFLAAVGFLLAFLFLVAKCTGCASASRAEARGAVLATAQAVKIADETCATYARENIDAVLARACSRAYRDARLSLILATDGVDAWDDSRRGHVICAVVHAAESLARTVAEFKQRKITVPAVLEDALRLTSMLGGCRS